VRTRPAVRSRCGLHAHGSFSTPLPLVQMSGLLHRVVRFYTSAGKPTVCSARSPATTSPLRFHIAVVTLTIILCLERASYPDYLLLAHAMVFSVAQRVSLWDDPDVCLSMVRAKMTASISSDGRVDASRRGMASVLRGTTGAIG
jgi:hypothetical protein